MINERQTLTLRSGMDVFGSDGEKVGSVADLQGDYVVVSKGFFFPTDYYIPVSAINNADDEGAYLNVTKDAALNQGWDSRPANFTESSAATGSAYANGTAYPESTTNTDRTGNRDQFDNTAQTKNGADTRDWPIDNGAGTGQTRSTDSETIRVPLSEEELTASTHPVDRGTVRVNKVVTESEQTLDVPVTEERVNVSRKIVDRDVAPGESTFEEGTIEIPLHGEDVDVQKNAHVREELEVSKDLVKNTKQVKGTVRKEEAHLQDATGTDIPDTQAKTRKGSRK